MNCKFNLSLSIFVAVAVAAGGMTQTAQSQGYASPKSNTGGFAQQRLQSIYQRDIGTGYSGSSINQTTLWNSQARVPFVGQKTALPSSRPSSLGLNSTPTRSNKPFTNYSPSPTVSPYLNLFRQDLSGNSDFNYQTLVKPLLQQQQFNQQSQRQSLELNRRLQSIAAQGDYNMEGSKDQYPTGHQTAFQYYGRYYPGMQARPRQRKQ